MTISAPGHARRTDENYGAELNKYHRAYGASLISDSPSAEAENPGGQHGHH
jgi:hypothetical protein